MKDICRIVGVTYGEFQAWISYGETRLLRTRLVDVPVVPASGGPDGSSAAVEILVSRTPALGLDDEEGLLFVQVQSKGLTECATDVQSVRVPAEAIERVIPLTSRARRILESRLGGAGVRLSEPYFEATVCDARLGDKVRDGLAGGDALIRGTGETSGALIGDDLRAAVGKAIRGLDADDEVFLDADRAAESFETWIPPAFSWTRHRPSDRGALDYLIDAGHILTGFGREWLEPLREAVKRMDGRLGRSVRLGQMLADPDFQQTAAQLETARRDVFPASLVVLIIFLRLKEQFHGSGGRVDFEAIGAELRDLQRQAPIGDPRIPLWLIGCFAGHERVAPYAYAVRAGDFKWYGGSAHEPLIFPEPAVDDSASSGSNVAEEVSALEASTIEADEVSDRAHPRPEENQDPATILLHTAQGAICNLLREHREGGMEDKEIAQALGDVAIGQVRTWLNALTAETSGMAVKKRNKKYFLSEQDEHPRLPI